MQCKWIVVTATCAYLAAVVWQRRWTLVPKSLAFTERYITVSLILQLAALLLRTPLSDRTIGYLLHAASGQWNLDVWLSDCLCIGAAGCIGVNVGSRLNISQDRLLAGFKRWFEIPMTLVVPVLLLLLEQSPNANIDTPDMFNIPVDRWLAAYWTLLCGFLIYVMATVVAVLRILRKDPRNRRTADVYLMASIAAIAACALRMVTAWVNTDYDEWFYLAGCIVSAAFAYAAGNSWRHKINWLKGTRPSTAAAEVTESDYRYSGD